MYGWRVGALRDWVRENTSNGQTLTMAKMAEEVGHLDQLHYRGLQANDDVIDVLSGGTGNLKGKVLLDAGCGIGGPARYIAWKTGCQVIGLDIQQDLINEANVLKPLIDDEFALGAEACKLYACDMTDKASFSNFVKPSSVDGWFSHLVFLHIPLPRREESFKNLFGTLKSGGRFSIEDYVLMGTEKLLPNELKVLDEVVGACALPTKSEYEATLRSCCEKSYGRQQLEISSLDFEDMSETWTTYTAGRRESFAANRAVHVKLHGEASAKMMENFYNAVADLFAGGRLGGAKITGQVAARSA